MCQYVRSSRAKIWQANIETSPNFGHEASQKFCYYGYKLYAVCSVDGVFEVIDIAPANIHGIHFLDNIANKKTDIMLIGGKRYLNEVKPKCRCGETNKE